MRGIDRWVHLQRFLLFMVNKIKMYLDWKGSHAHRASINYRIWVERFVEVCGTKALEEYSVSDFVQYQSWLETRYSSSTVQFATIVIKNFFQFFKHQNYNCLSPSLIKIANKWWVIFKRLKR